VHHRGFSCFAAFLAVLAAVEVVAAPVKPNIVLTSTVGGNPAATVEVKVAPDGTIVSRKLVTSSGSPTWDETVLRAIDKTEVLPKDVDGRVPPTIVITFHPND